MDCTLELAGVGVRAWSFQGYAETKEQLGGIQILEARDLNHAVQLISQVPGFKYGLGPVEIRQVADLNERMKESEQRRQQKHTWR